MRFTQSRSAVIVMLLLTAAIASPAKPKFKVIHTFHGKDGAGPFGLLVRDGAGNFYGTTALGGNGACWGYTCGTAFKLDKNGRQVWVHDFHGKNGWFPLVGLLRDTAGNLFGTTEFGGDLSCQAPYGCGTVFRLDKTGRKENVLHKFNGSDGTSAETQLVQDSAGNLYGAVAGGNGYGVVFKMDRSGRETILYNFSGGADGCGPAPGVIRDSAGNIYGETLTGGLGFCSDGYGVVFKLDMNGNETVLHTFQGSDGATPDSILLVDSKGNLYGTTRSGGSSEGCTGGCGTVFELSPQNGNWSETVLYNFCSVSGCTDGSQPTRSALVRGTSGTLYGTTVFGGTYANCSGQGCGVVFQLDTTGNEIVLHSFTGGTDGATPNGGLTVSSGGEMFGSTSTGGDLKCALGDGEGCGVVFRISP